MSESFPPPEGRRRGLIVAVAILAALLLVVAASTATLLLTGRLTVADAAATPVTTTSETPTPTPTPTPTATTVVDSAGGKDSSGGSGSSGSSGGSGSSGSSGGSTASSGSISSADVFIEGDDSCAASANVSLVGTWSATGTTLWFGVNTTDASSAPYQQWSLASSGTTGTVDGFVYDCSRSSENFTFTLLRTDGTKTSTTITLHNCAGLEDQSPRRSCAAE